MFCPKCGNQVTDNARFCPKCGYNLTTGGAVVPTSTNGHSGRRKTVTFLAIGITFALLLVIGAIAYLGFNGETVSPSPILEDGRYVFNEQILQEFEASSSDAVPTTAEVASSLAQRGFENVVITSGYDQAGNPSEEEPLDPSSTAKHPLYNAYYITPDGNAWVIYICNGSFMADPLFLYDSSTPGYMIVEEDYVTSYSSNEDKFIQTIPDESELVTKRVDKIDAALLDGLDERGIEGL